MYRECEQKKYTKVAFSQNFTVLNPYIAHKYTLQPWFHSQSNIILLNENSYMHLRISMQVLMHLRKGICLYMGLP